MQAFLIPPLEIGNEKFKEPIMWDEPILGEIATQTNLCKAQIDEPYKHHQKKWEMYTRQMEPSDLIKRTLVKQYRPQLVTNAFLKLIEMNAAFDLISNNGDDIRLFDNASAPGSFIMAANFWVSTMTKNKLKWMASSFISEKGNTALDDKYGLARLHPHLFTTTGTKYNGDTTNVQYLRYIKKQYGGMFDTYVSDLGMHVGEGEYHMQEAINAKGNLGQALMGLLVLRIGGDYLTKQYTHYSSFTVSLIGILSMCFEKTFIVKPMTSKADNSEEYIIGKGFLGVPPYILDIMFDKLEHTWVMERENRNFITPLLPRDIISDEFMSVIVETASVFANQQCEKIDVNLAEFQNMLDKNTTTPSPQFLNMHVYKQKDKWFKIAKFKIMPKQSFIRTVYSRN